MNTALPIDSNERKDIPLARGVLDYFPAALAEVARLSKAGNDKHNPGEDLHWARGKSMDHADCIMRHLAERGTIDTDGLLHDAKVAWRALAMLQEALEKRGAPLPRGARLVTQAVLIDFPHDVILNSIPGATIRCHPSQTFVAVVGGGGGGCSGGDPQAPRDTRAWNEGWKCARCGTTELWHDETAHTVTHEDDVLCATPACLGHMVRS